MMIPPDELSEKGLNEALDFCQSKKADQSMRHSQPRAHDGIKKVGGGV